MRWSPAPRSTPDDSSPPVPWRNSPTSPPGERPIEALEPSPNGPATSVLHQLPLGGESLDAYEGSPRLVRASGEEPFDTVAEGQPAVEFPEPGEVVWCDGAGVTCRRWNWRQGRRTRLEAESRSAVFILDVLDPMTDTELHAAAEELIGHLHRFGPDVQISQRLLPRLAG